MYKHIKNFRRTGFPFFREGTTSGHSRQAAFTLIELLTVIAIIGILAAILIPVVSSVRESARASRCIGNLRALNIGLQLFLEDNNGRIQVWGGGSGGTEGWQWYHRMTNEGFLDDGDVTLCPSQHPYYWDDEAGHPVHFRVYGMNMIQSTSPLSGNRDYFEASSVDGSLFEMNANAVRDPTRYFTFVDSVMPGDFEPAAGGGGGSQRYQIRNWQPTGLDGIHARHNDRANMAFLDGSVRVMGPRDLRQLGFIGYIDGEMNNVSMRN